MRRPPHGPRLLSRAVLLGRLHLAYSACIPARHEGRGSGSGQTWRAVRPAGREFPLAALHALTDDRPIWAMSFTVGGFYRVYFSQTVPVPPAVQEVCCMQ